MAKKIPTTVYLEASQLEALRKHSEVKRLPVALLIRDALEDYLTARDASGALRLVRESSPRRKVRAS